MEVNPMGKNTLIPFTPDEARNGKEVQTITSLEVAEMVEKPHKNLLRDIRTYLQQLAETKIEPGDFFTESTYLDANNQNTQDYGKKKVA